MIIPSKQALLIAPTQAKQIFMFDPKTSCVLHKYSTETAMGSSAAFYEAGHQFIIPHLNNTYVNIWETDFQQPRKYSVGEGEKVTSLIICEDSIMYMGTASGNILVYEIPSGVLIRRKSLHSSQILKIQSLSSGHLLTCSQSQIKLWPLKDILAEQVKPIPDKSVHSATPIITFVIIRNICCVLSQNNLRFFFSTNLGIVSMEEDLPQIHNATCCTHSEDQIYIGDAHGKIKRIPIIPHKKQLAYDQRRLTNSLKKKTFKQFDGKDPITTLQYVSSLELLISGNCKGQVKIWTKQGLKNSLQLFKTAIGNLHLIPKIENQQKIVQNLKISALHKQQMTKLECTTLIGREDGIENENFPIEAGNQHYLSLMVDYLNDPTQFLEGDIAILKEENAKMLQANLHYAQMLDNLDS